MNEPQSGALRADAARNRARILQAARELYAVRGLDVTLDDIADHAGVGVATVYRRFGDRNALVEALFRERLEAQADIARACLDDPDPWRSFVTLFESGCEELSGDVGMRQIVLSSAYGLEGVAQARDRLVPMVDEVLTRAQAAGVVRTDLVATDIPVLFLSIAIIGELGGTAAPDVWRRVLGVMLDGLRPSADQQPLSPGVTSAEFEKVLADYRPAHPKRSHPLPAVPD